MKQFVWILLFAPLLLKAEDRIVTVALDGSADFVNPIAAMQSISDASDTRRYVIQIAPGRYYLQGNRLVVKPYVSIVGSGSENTILQSATSATQDNLAAACVVSVARSEEERLEGFDPTLKGLTIRNQGAYSDAEVACGLRVFSNRVKATDIKIDLRVHAGKSYGIWVSRGALTLLESQVDIENFSRNIGESTGILSEKDSHIDVWNTVIDSKSGKPQTDRVFGVVLDGGIARFDRATISAAGTAFRSAETFSLEVHYSRLSGWPQGVDLDVTGFRNRLIGSQIFVRAPSTGVTANTALRISGTTLNAGQANEQEPAAFVRDVTINGTFINDLGDNLVCSDFYDIDFQAISCD